MIRVIHISTGEILIIKSNEHRFEEIIRDCCFYTSCNLRCNECAWNNINWPEEDYIIEEI